MNMMKCRAVLFLNLTVLLLLSSVSCMQDLNDGFQRQGDEILVGYRFDDHSTKTQASNDGLTTIWKENDETALWARNSSGSYILEAQRFSMLGEYGERGWFTSTLSSAMPDDTYTYYAAYPYPVSVDGTVVTYRLPSLQDGQAADGADIMLSSAAQAPALQSLADTEPGSGLSLSMKHLLHILRFYIPDNARGLDGEAVRRIVFKMPQSVAGTLNLDVTAPEDVTLTSSTDEIVLELAKPLEVSSVGGRNYAFATIFPFTAAAADQMEARMYTDTKCATVRPVNLRAKSFQPGHATAVALVPDEVTDLYRLTFTVAANNLGEDVDSITLTAPQGCDWGTGSNIYTYAPASAISAGSSFSVEMSDYDAYLSLSNANIQVQYDSPHVLSSESVTLASLESTSSSDVELNVPYLLYEDFSGVQSFSSNDAYATLVTGNKNAVSFLGGWTAARAGASAGLGIRIACRRETSSDYSARADSKPLFTIKKAVDIEVTYDYGANFQAGGIPILSADGKVGQNVYLGYVTDMSAYSSSSTAGTFEAENQFYIKEQTGSYTSLPHSTSMIIHSIPAGSANRLTFRTVSEHQAGTTNTTSWLYLDNIRVRVAPGQ